MIGGDYRLGTVGAHLLMTPIMEQDHVAAANLFCHLALDRRRWGGVPVVTGDVPHDGFEAEFAGHAEGRGAASSEGRAEKIRRLADGVLQGVAAFGEFLSDLGFALEDQERM